MVKGVTKKMFVPFNKLTNRFNHFTQYDFDSSDNVIAMRWKRDKKLFVSYYEISSIFKWTFQKELYQINIEILVKKEV